jgi:pellino protein
MLTADQATAVATYLIAHTPWASGELEALGYAIATARGALLHLAPVLPAVLPRWDDVACVVLSVAEQTGGIRLSIPGPI